MSQKPKESWIATDGLAISLFVISVTGPGSLPTANAQTTSWQGQISSDWSAPLNWSSSLVPTAGTVRVESITPNTANASGVTVGLSTLYVGAGAATQGVLSLADGSSFTVGTVQIGQQGQGSLSLVNSQVQATSTSVGDFGAGSLTLSGAQTQYRTTNNMIVGGFASGYGAVTVDTGAYLAANGFGLGNGRGAAEATFDNATAEFGRFINQVGARSDTRLTIRNGSTVSVGDYMWVGGFDNSVAYLTVDGPNTTLSVVNDAFVGWDGQGKAVVSNNASLSANRVIIGNFAKFGNGDVLLTSGATLRAGQDLIIGLSGKGYLTVSDNASVSAPRIILGAGAPLTDTDGTVYTSFGELSMGGRRTESAKAIGNITATTFQFGDGDGVLLFNHTSDNYVFDATLNNGADNLPGSGTGLVGAGLVEAIAGRTIFDADHGDFTGRLQASSAGILQINGDMSRAATAILSGGRLEGNGAVGPTTNAGTIAPGSSLGTLTVSGNYVGAGGLLEIESVLGGDQSPTDRLVIQGDSSGQTFVKVINREGAGAPTVEGIRIIEVGGVSAGTFSLGRDYTTKDNQGAVIAGAYAYTLHQHGIQTPTDGDWYLRSTMIETPIDPEVPGQPTPEPSPPPDVPRYGANVPVYEAYPQVLQALNGLPTLRQRVGNRYWANAQSQDAAADAAGAAYGAPGGETGVGIDGRKGLWARIEGAHHDFSPRDSTTDADYDVNTFKLQAGFDSPVYETAGGRLIGGITAHYAHGSADIWSRYDAIDGDGRISTDGYGFGATLTWYAENGFYLDGQAQVTWYDSDLRYRGGGTKLKSGNDGFGHALSIEGGQRFALDPNWSLTPQAQLTYSSVDFDTFTDPYGAKVSLSRGDSLVARMGVAVEHQDAWYKNGQTHRTSAYVITNLYYDFLQGSKVRVSGSGFTSRQDSLWGGIGVGGSYSWNDNKYTIYGEGLVNTSLRDFGDSYSVKGQVGFRVVF